MRPSSPDLDAASSARGVVLVEGISDKLALEALARRIGRDLDAEGVSVLPIGGAQAIGKVLGRLGPGGVGVKLFGSNLGRADMEALGFYVCDADLEDELVRSLGAAVVERVIEAEGEWASFQTFQKQPEKRRLTREAQLHGFMWNRKIRYARLLVDALDLAQVPRPLDRVLGHI
jgi:hypothetical protein